MVKYILALSLVAAAARAGVASDAETKQEEHQTRELVGAPTYWPTYWPTYFPTEAFEELEVSDGEKAAVHVEEVKEVRYVPPPPAPQPEEEIEWNKPPPPPPPPVKPEWNPPPPVETEWNAPPPPVETWTDDGWSESTSWAKASKIAPMWDDDGWDGWSSGKAGKRGKGSWKCSKAGKVSYFNIIRIHTACNGLSTNRVLTTSLLVTYFVIFNSIGSMGKSC